MEPEPILRSDLLATLTPQWPDSALRTRIREATIASGRRVVVLDDDPTGTQTVHDLPVVTEWSPDVLAAAWDESATTFYVLTNSRRYPLDRAAAINREVARSLTAVARAHGAEPIVVSRSDSTLRGHYPGEVSALQQTLEAEMGVSYDGVVIAPFFLEGGRLTVNDVHWVAEGERLTPAAQTEFSRDPTFGYTHSHLPQWIEEKTAGQVRSGDTLSISLEAVRDGGPARVAEMLSGVSDGQVVVANATAYRDLEVFVWGLMQADSLGKRFLFRTAASFVKVRGGVPDRGPLGHEGLFVTAPDQATGGLTLAGSYVQRTSLQLDEALTLDRMLGLELNARAVLEQRTRSEHISSVVSRTTAGLQQGQDVLVYTSRALIVPAGMSQLQASQQVSAALVEVLRRLPVRPAYLAAKGGITSSDLATDALSVRRARVLGQIIPGVPVWRLGPESKYPDLPYVVFPGNVGGPAALASTIRILRGE